MNDNLDLQYNLYVLCNWMNLQNLEPTVGEYVVMQIGFYLNNLYTLNNVDIYYCIAFEYLGIMYNNI